MHQSINKKKIYFYLLILIFLSTSFNFSFIKNIKEFSLVKKINILGLDDKEHEVISDELKILLNKNIFFIGEDQILEILKDFNFLSKITVKKIFPSKLNILLEKTIFLGITYVDGNKFLIGKNGKLTSFSQVENNDNLPLIFGNFSPNEFLILQDIFELKKFDFKMIKKYFYYKSKRWDLVNLNGTIIKLPSTNIKNSLEIYQNLVDNNKLKKVNIVDLRIPNQITLTYEEE